MLDRPLAPRNKASWRIVEQPLPIDISLTPDSRDILLGGTASHVRISAQTPNPSVGLPWQGTLRPRCIPRPGSLRAPHDPMTKSLRALGTRPRADAWGPSGETSFSLRPMTEALPLRHRSGAAVLLKTMAGATVPLRPTPGSYRAPKPILSGLTEVGHQPPGFDPEPGEGA